MPNPMFISEVTIRSLDVIARSYKDRDPEEAVETMKVAIRLIARRVARWRLSGEAKAHLFLRPMEEALVHHYGSQLGRRIYWDYLEAFWLQSWSVEPLPLAGFDRDHVVEAFPSDRISDILIGA